MEAITGFSQLDFSAFLLSAFVLILGLKSMAAALEWLFDRLGLEFNWMRKKREDHELLIKTANNLSELQKRIAKTDSMRDVQIESLKLANRELLADKINQKYKNYISIGGIPEDEVDEFTNLHFAYKGCGGNHHGDAKYEYVMEHLPVIPVEVRLVYKES